MRAPLHRSCLTLLALLSLSLGFRLGAQTVGVDESFTPKFFTYGEVPEMFWNPTSEWLYCRVVADRIDGQDLTTNLLRLDADGEWDNTWALTHDGDITCLALLDDGKMLIGGDFTQVDSHTTYRVARLNVDGSIDTTFTATSNDLPAPDGEAFVDALAADDSGNVFVGLFCQNSSYSGDFLFCIGPTSATFNIAVSGTIDGGFSDTYKGVKAIYTDGNSLIIGGCFTQVNGIYRTSLAKVSLTGSVDPGLDIDLASLHTSYNFPSVGVYDIVEASDGNLWVGGAFNVGNRHGLMRIATSGQLLSPSSIDDPYNRYENGFLRDIAADGVDVLTMGYLWGPSFGSRISFHNRVNTSGEFVEHFRSGSFTSSIEVVDDKVAVGKGNPYYNATSISNERAITYWTPTGVKIESIDVKLFAPTTPTFATVRAGNRPLYYGDHIAGINDAYVYGLFGLNADGSYDTSFQPDFNGNVISALVLPDDRILLLGAFSRDDWASRRGLIVIDSDGTVAAPFGEVETGFYASYYVCQSMLLPSGEALITSARGFDGVENAGMLLINPQQIDAYQDLAASFQVDEVYTAIYFGDTQSYDVTSAVQAALTGGQIEMQVTDAGLGVTPTDPSEKMQLIVSYRTVFGDHEVTVDEEDDLALPRITWDSGIAKQLPISPQTSSFNSVVAQSDGRLVFRRTSSQLERVFPDGSLDPSFQPPTDFHWFSVSYIFVDGLDRIYMKGTFEKDDGDKRVALIRLMPDGTHDNTFQCDVSFPLERAVALDYEGNFYFSGYASSALVAKNFLVRISNDGTIDNSILDIQDQSQYVDYYPPNFVYANDKRYLFNDPIPPEVFITPGTAHANEGDDVTFWLADRGAEETYQWSQGGTPLPGHTGPSLTLDPTTLGHAGEIGVEATGPGGTIMRTAMLDVTGYDFNQWGTLQGYTAPELTDPDADLNGNGLSLNDEFLLRTDLFGPATRTWASPIWDGSALTLHFNMLPGRRYWIDCSTNLVDWTPIDSYTSTAAEPVAIEVAFDPETPCFYQVRAELIAE